MEYRHFKYVLKIAEMKSISLAAKQLYISQPSLSQLLQKIERGIGAPLFDRDVIPLQPTYIGKLYLRMARQVLDIDEQFRQQADDIMNLKRGSVRIGSSPFRSTYLLSKFIPFFKKKYPGIELFLKESTTLKLEEAVFDGEADISISLFPMDEKRFSYKVLFLEPLLAAVPADNPICIRLKAKAGNLEHIPEIDLAELAKEQFIIMSGEQKQHQIFLDMCRRAGFTPKIFMETGSMNTAHALAGAGMGVTVLPQTLIENAPRQAKPPCYFCLKGDPKRTVTVIWRKERYLSHAARALIDSLMEFVKVFNGKNFSAY